MANVVGSARGILFILLGVGVFASVINGGPHGGSAPVASTEDDASNQSTPAQVRPVVTPSTSAPVSDATLRNSIGASNSGPTSKWSYDNSEDQLRGTTTRFATLVSENQVQFGLPYGESDGKIILRQAAKSLDVMLTVDQGQFICNPFENDTVVVKFDGGAIQHFACAEAADGSTNVIFLRNAARFVRELKKSNRVQIEAEFFQAGLQQLAFNSAGLKW